MSEPASTRAHAAVPFMNPMGEADVDAAIGALGLGAGARVVETGCGGAELLMRVLEAWPGARGVGVDPDPHALGRARAAAASRLAAGRLELVEARAEDAGLPAGAFDLVVNVASSHAHGGFPDALPALAALARDDRGLILYGEGFWAREPSPEYLDALGGATADELPLGAEALERAADEAGLDVVVVRAAAWADFDAYEEGLAAAAERYADADAAAYAARIRSRRALPDGTRTMGFALLTLRRA
ncbi:MAG TPA: class I SAM-dependent methyltransferase [Baekduia sp.]|nr:class I SAM-dependent methyltransferase [Baekduia sp.]